MFRYTVPVDDAAHEIALTGDPVAVDSTGLVYHVQFWAEHDDDALGVTRVFQVFRTGQDLPAGARWVGSCMVTPNFCHLYELPAAPR